MRIYLYKFDIFNNVGYLRITSFTEQTEEGIKTKYKLCIYGSQKNPNNIDFFKSLVKDNVMTLDRKKQKVQEFVNHVS